RRMGGAGALAGASGSDGQALRPGPTLRSGSPAATAAATLRLKPFSALPFPFLTFALSHLPASPEPGRGFTFRPHQLRYALDACGLLSRIGAFDRGHRAGGARVL